jgi:uncharacterized protein (DUF302 family)/uncharacterized membrane protein YidH (DUF202 family)
MDSTKPAERANLSDFLAVERTFLAWMRTGLALMGFGFVVARFGLFLEEFHAALPGSAPSSHQFSLWSGTALIAVGVAVNLYSAWRHVGMVSALNRGETGDMHSARQAVIVAVILAAFGLAMAAFLTYTNVQVAPADDKKRSSAPQGAFMTPATDNGIVSKLSTHSVDQTVEKLRSILQAKGIMLFALVDHSGEAEKAGMKMPPTKLLIFGNPKGGTPLMLAAPSTAIDLPLKILVFEDPNGRAWISYNSPAYLQRRHGFPPELLPNIAVIEALVAQAVS